MNSYFQISVILKWVLYAQGSTARQLHSAYAFKVLFFIVTLTDVNSKS